MERLSYLHKSFDVTIRQVHILNCARTYAARKGRKGVSQGYCETAPACAILAPDNRGGVAKWLRRRSAKPLFVGSTPTAASIIARTGGTYP